MEKKIKIGYQDITIESETPTFQKQYRAHPAQYPSLHELPELEST